MLQSIGQTALEEFRQSSVPHVRDEELPSATRTQTSEDADVCVVRVPMPPVSMALAPIPSVVATPVSSRNTSFAGAATAHAVNTVESGAADAEIKVDTKPAVIGYFGYMFGGAACGAFYSTVFTEHGFSPRFVGIMMAIIPLFSLFLLPVLSFVADKFRCPKQMLAVCAVVATLSLVVFTNGTVAWVIVSGFIMQIASQCPMNPLLDQQTLSMFPKKHRTERWGYVRAFGAYGWGFGNPVASLIAEYGGWGYAPLQFAIGQVALLYCVWTAKPYEEVEKVPVKIKDVFRVLRDHPRLLLFLIASALMGMGYSFINAFLFIFLTELGAPRFLLGLTVLVTVSTEIPIFQYSKYLHRWFTDRHMMTLAMCIWAVRVLGYSFLSNPWYVLFLEPFHGVTFGLMWLPGVHMINVAFPPQLASSATGILFTFSSGIGPIIGNIVGGFVYQAKGGAWAFRFLSFFMLTAMVCYQLLDRYLEKKGFLMGEHEREQEGAVVVAADDHAAVSAESQAKPVHEAAKDAVITGTKE